MRRNGNGNLAKEKWVTLSQAARETGKDIGTLSKMAKSGRIEVKRGTATTMVVYGDEPISTVKQEVVLVKLPELRKYLIIAKPGRPKGDGNGNN